MRKMTEANHSLSLEIGLKLEKNDNGSLEQVNIDHYNIFNTKKKNLEISIITFPFNECNPLKSLMKSLQFKMLKIKLLEC